MANVIDNLFKRYESGLIARRELIRSLTALIPLLPSDPEALADGFQATSLNHVEINVSNVQRSTDFYQRVLGLSVHGHHLIVGKSFLSLHQANPPGIVDHFALGIGHFNKNSNIEELKRRGATISEEGESSFHVKDPDGCIVQIISDDFPV